MKYLIRGLTFKGGPCRKGHVLEDGTTIRRHSNKVCVECSLISSNTVYSRKREIAIKNGTCLYCDELQISGSLHCRKHLDLNRERLRKQLYGLSREDVHEMFEAQNGCCAICRIPFSEFKMYVDHDHKTQKVRGLLCPRCNNVIGFVNDDQELLNSAIEYLKDSL